MKIPEHYSNEKGSLYKFAEDFELNAYEFDIVKRIVRCRKKGQFKEDLEKTKTVIDIYLGEHTENKEVEPYAVKKQRMDEALANCSCVYPQEVKRCGLCPRGHMFDPTKA